MAKDNAPPADKDQEGSDKPKRAAAIAPQSTPDNNPFLLEDLYPDPVDLFAPTLVESAAGSGVLVAIDTNALLLPYTIGKDDLGALATTYKTLAGEKRLFLPARAAREFIKHRDRKIAELVQAMADQRSRIAVAGGGLPPILEGADGYQELQQAAATLAEGKKSFAKAQDRLRTSILAWRGNDPVTALYSEVFGVDNIVEHEGEREDLQKEWAIRLRDKIPPGYKDSTKADTGIGDFLVWKALLRLGREHKKDLIFVTGEGKADWFVRSAGEPVFARPELIAEYRAASDGHNLQLSGLADLLSQFGATSSVVDEVRSAEASANSSIRSRRAAFPFIVHWSGHGTGVAGGEAFFDYSEADGRIDLPSEGGGFALKFSKASDERIHLYRDSGLVAIMRLKDVLPGAKVDLEQFDSSSTHYTINKGEAFAAVNLTGEVLIARITHISDDTRGAAADEVRFDYRIYPGGTGLISP